MSTSSSLSYPSGLEPGISWTSTSFPCDALVPVGNCFVVPASLVVVGGGGGATAGGLGTFAVALGRSIGATGPLGETGVSAGNGLMFGTGGPGGAVLGALGTFVEPDH